MTEIIYSLFLIGIGILSLFFSIKSLMNPAFAKKYWSFPYSEDILKKKALCAIVFLYKHVLNKNGYVPNLFTLKMSICSHTKTFYI